MLLHYHTYQTLLLTLLLFTKILIGSHYIVYILPNMHVCIFVYCTGGARCLTINICLDLKWVAGLYKMDQTPLESFTVRHTDRNISTTRRR